MSELRDKAISLSLSLLLNGGVFAGMAWAGFGDEARAVEPTPPPFDWVDVTPMPRRGEIKDPQGLIRITSTPPAPPAQAASLSREQEERAAPRPKLRPTKPHKATKPRSEVARPSTQADPRADIEDLPPGRPDGAALGTVTHGAYGPTARYISQISHVLSRQFKIPSSIAPAERARLSAKIHFLLDERGALKGEPTLIESSGDHRFDAAALRAVKRFSVGSGLRLPLPSDTLLKARVLQEGVNAIMRED